MSLSISQTFCRFYEYHQAVALTYDTLHVFFNLEVSSGQPSSQDPGKVLHRATTSVHVCWHRSSTFSMSDILRANEV